jgi:hypothetical protein
VDRFRGVKQLLQKNPGLIRLRNPLERAIHNSDRKLEQQIGDGQRHPHEDAGDEVPAKAFQQNALNWCRP